MTNAQIVLTNSIRLMEEGILSGTGELVTVELGGEEMQIELPETIHTYAAWKKLGFQVMKGEKAVAKFPIWAYSKSKKKTEDGEEEKARMFLKSAAWFKSSQVMAIEQ